MLLLDTHTITAVTDSVLSTGLIYVCKLLNWTVLVLDWWPVWIGVSDGYVLHL